MPTTIQQVTGFLDEYELTYDVKEEYEAIGIGFSLDESSTTYRDQDGDAHLQLVIRVVEDGEFVVVLAPQAWNIDACPHKAAVFETLVALQARFKLLRFDYDPDDGEIRPNVELPVEDSSLSSKQFHRLMHAVIIGVQRLDRVVRHAMETGTVCLDLMEEKESGDSAGVDHLDADDKALLESLEDLAEEAGGIDALERLLGGEGLASDDEPGADRKAG
jgi:hypothetical protein